MKFPINIQSISDLITNSSSEVFICSVSGDPNSVCDSLQEFIDELMRLCGYDGYDYAGAEVYVADSDGRDKWYDYSWKEGDVIVESREDNSIPYVIMEALKNLPYIPRFENEVTNIKRHHLG